MRSNLVQLFYKKFIICKNINKLVYENILNKNIKYISF